MEIKEKNLLKALEMLNNVSVVGIANMANMVTAYQLLTGVATVEEKKGEGDNGTK
jgi:hypothetical protein|nr:MAG TPA: hypothetical protein [Caudoviricetes sp.]DAU30461.1 MAG TPA: hypothetical protein [Caudoviricetes sp.]